MNKTDLKKILAAVKTGTLSVSGAMERLRLLPFQDLGHARVDLHRELRCGFPEVVLCQGKTTEQILNILDVIVKGGGRALATRAAPEVFDAVLEKHPEAHYNKMARMIVIQKQPPKVSGGLILVITAGTSDIPVAEEARVTAEAMGNRVETLYDAGVAGIHRLLSSHSDLAKANVLVVAAGMEGALASVVGGLVDRPVIAVPTSVGYGASFGGIAALLGMLNSCSANVCVVNIDNGFGAGYVASLINQTGTVRTKKETVRDATRKKTPQARHS
ncbi:MAG: nickel pincer cofactor biosynthesis protein LarB [Planctomycetes bacterium]|nr:nickel pincer cofactor biosynthesis protein LarB [Planctomycetota bacterium]